MSPLLHADLPHAGRDGAPRAAARQGRAPAAARDRARRAPRRRRHADRLRAAGVLPRRQRRDRAGAGRRGLRRGDPQAARAAAARCRCTAAGPRRQGVREADDRVVRGRRDGGGERRRLRLGHEGLRRRAGRRPGVGRAGRRSSPPRRATSRSSWPSWARAPPGTRWRSRVAYHDACHLAHAQGIRAQPRDAAEGHPRPGGQGDRRTGDLLRLGRRLQPPAAGGRRRAGRPQGAKRFGHQGGSLGGGQSRLLAADRHGAAPPRARRSRWPTPRKYSTRPFGGSARSCSPRR